MIRLVHSAKNDYSTEGGLDAGWLDAGWLDAGWLDAGGAAATWVSGIASPRPRCSAAREYI
jgi:hypothetical protein